MAVVVGSAGFAGGVFYWHTGAHIAGQPAWLIAGLLYATSFGLTAALIFRFLPKLGPFMILTSISRLLLASASVVAPAIAVALTTSPVLNATLVVLGAVLIRAVSRASWPARTRAGFQVAAKPSARFQGGL